MVAIYQYHVFLMVNLKIFKIVYSFCEIIKQNLLVSHREI